MVRIVLSICNLILQFHQQQLQENKMTLSFQTTLSPQIKDQVHHTLNTITPFQGANKKPMVPSGTKYEATVEMDGHFYRNL